MNNIMIENKQFILMKLVSGRQEYNSMKITL